MNKTSPLELAKKYNIPRRNCTKTKEELKQAIKDTTTMYEEIIFVPDSPVCMVCLNELRKKQVIDGKVYDRKLMYDTLRKFAWDELQKNIVMDGDTMIDRRTGEVLDPEADLTYWKNKILRVDFMVFADYKITYCKA